MTLNREELVQEMNNLHIEHAKKINQLLSQFASSGEPGVLLYLREQQGETYAVDIIDHFGLTPGRVANIVKKLEERGFIERQISFQDMRKYCIQLTDSGRVQADKLYEQMSQKHLKFIEALGEDEIIHVIGNLNKILPILES